MNAPIEQPETWTVDFWAGRIAALIKLAEHYGMTVEIAGGELVVSRQVSDVFVARTEVRWSEPERAVVPSAHLTGSAVSGPPPAPRADASCVCGEPEAPSTVHRTDGPCHTDDRREAIALAIARVDAGKWGTEVPLREHPMWQAYLAYGEAVIAMLTSTRKPELRRLADEAQQPDDGEGDELVCVDECGFCNACGFEPFGTPAEGWREAARFLRRTARDSGDRQGALHGARLIEAELRRLADESGPCVAGEQQNETPEARRCGHTDIVYGRCVRFIDDHEGECVHEHQPAAGVRQDGAQQ